MANYIVQDTSLETVADAIRAKAGISEKLMFPDGWKAAVDGIQSGSGGGSVEVDYVTATTTASESKATFVKKVEDTSDPTNGICTIDGSNAWVYRTFLQHDFSSIPSGAEILSATLKVFVSSVNDNYTSSRCYVGRMLGEWAEDVALTWSNQPGHQSYSSGSSETPQVSPSIGASNWIEVDITTVVREWYDGAYPNHGIVIRAIE
jgi:hypothetical protein